MANPLIIYSNQSTWNITGSHQTASGYPWSNLNDYEPDTVWKSSVNNTDQYLQIDLGTAKAISNIIIDNHNLYDTLMADAIMRITGSNNVNMSSPTYTGQHSPGSLGNVSLWNVDITPSVARYWRFNFVAAPSWDSGIAPYIGNISMCTPLTFTTPYQNVFKTQNTQYETNEYVSLSGIIRTSQTYNGRVLYEIKFAIQTDALRTAFQTFITSVRGKLLPFYFVDTDGTTIYYFHLADDYVPVITDRYNQNTIESLVMRTHKATY